MITRAINPVSGFSQGLETYTGLERFWDENLLSRNATDCIVYPPATWKMTTSRRLEQMQRLGVKSVFFLGYSHGTHPILEMAAKAQRYGIETVHIHLWDPIGRNPLLPRWDWAQLFTARSLTPWMRIHIPETVQRVTWCRQRQDLPRAHDLKWNPRTTQVIDAHELPVGHTNVQWHPDAHRLALEALEHWLSTDH
jgi:hypothetical protein